MFFKSPLSIELQKTWTPVSITNPSINKKNTEVWVYNAKSLEFIEKLDRVTHPGDEFNVSKTTMSRCLNHNISLEQLRSCEAAKFINFILIPPFYSSPLKGDVNKIENNL